MKNCFRVIDAYSIDSNFKKFCDLERHFLPRPVATRQGTTVLSIESRLNTRETFFMISMVRH